MSIYIILYGFSERLRFRHLSPRLPPSTKGQLGQWWRQSSVMWKKNKHEIRRIKLNKKNIIYFFPERLRIRHFPPRLPPGTQGQLG